jgi:hypothetical protein
VFTGGDPDPDTTAGGHDQTVADPALFDAVTPDRNVNPRSADRTRYDDPVAPLIDTQLPPDELQRHH